MRVNVLNISQIIIRNSNIGYGELRNYVCQFPTAIIAANWFPHKEAAIVKTSYKPHHLLTYSMVQSPSWEDNWFAVSQEIPRISRNPKVHYRTHKRPPPVSILGQHNLVHIHISNVLEIHPNIIHPSTPRSPQWSLFLRSPQWSPSLRFPHQDPMHYPLLTHTRHMLNLSHSSRFYHPHNIGWEVQIT